MDSIVLLPSQHKNTAISCYVRVKDSFTRCSQATHDSAALAQALLAHPTAVVVYPKEDQQCAKALQEALSQAFESLCLRYGPLLAYVQPLSLTPSLQQQQLPADSSCAASSSETGRQQDSSFSFPALEQNNSCESNAVPTQVQQSPSWSDNEPYASCCYLHNADHACTPAFQLSVILPATPVPSVCRSVHCTALQCALPCTAQCPPSAPSHAAARTVQRTFVKPQAAGDTLNRRVQLITAAMMDCGTSVTALLCWTCTHHVCCWYTHVYC